MARASTRTMLPLDRFFQIIGMHPLHSNGIEVVGDFCGQPLMQYRWQSSDAIGREAIAEAIAAAEDRLSNYLGFYPVPRYIADERHAGVPQITPVKADWGYALSAGTEQKDLIESAAVVYSDMDGDGYAELATITLNTDVTETDELALYYPGHGGEDEWEIRPLLSVDIADGGAATITVKREQLVKEERTEGYTSSGIDGTDDAAFLDTVSVYRHWLNPNQQIQFLWRGPNCFCSTTNVCTACIQTGQFGCAIVADGRQSIFSVGGGLWDETNQTYIAQRLQVLRAPDRFRIWYRAGWRNMDRKRYNVQMDPLWERTIAYYSLGFLDKPLCACELTQSVINYWSEDLSVRDSSPGGSHSFAMSKATLENPLGPSRGAAYAWNLAQSNRIGEAVCVV